MEPEIWIKEAKSHQVVTNLSEGEVVWNREAAEVYWKFIQIVRVIRAQTEVAALIPE